MIKLFAVFFLLTMSPPSSYSTIVDDVYNCIRLQLKALQFFVGSKDINFQCVGLCAYDIIRNVTPIDLPKGEEPEICHSMNEYGKCKYAAGFRKCLPPKLDERFWKDLFTRI
ncbi:uncharacterized protein LOC27207697 [Drosophila simulans]|uniref:Uncharacterized protein n=1 Tax=Drosophila simulans TaxID=7240 RepID=A0A0J9RD61_DROSI|nr:uncharacterized protein LOC27207697 [Drosophila simulans]KMY93901.1 uncharacterized protein Dsimw501_GD27848 [Drosophila simulans]